MKRAFILLTVLVVSVTSGYSQILTAGINMMYYRQHTTIDYKNKGSLTFNIRYEFLPKSSPLNFGVGFVGPLFVEEGTSFSPLGGELTGRYRYAQSERRDLNASLVLRYLHGRFMSYQVPSTAFSGNIYKDNALDIQLSPLHINFYRKRKKGFWSVSPFIGGRWVFGSAPRNIYQTGNENQVNPFYPGAGVALHYHFSFKK